MERINPCKDVFWLLDVETSDGSGSRFCSRPFAAGGSVYRPFIMEIESCCSGFRAGGVVGNTSLKISLADPLSTEKNRIFDLEEAEGLYGKAADLALFLKDRDGLAGADDIILMDRLIIEEVNIQPDRVTLSLTDPLDFIAEKPILRTLTRLDIHYLEQGDDISFPVIIGRVETCPLIPIPSRRLSSPSMKLAREFTPEDISLTLNDASGLPEKGTLQVGDEVLEYRTRDEISGIAGSEASPLLRSEPGYHPEGTGVRLIPEEGLRFVAADHACHSISQLKAGGRPLSGVQVSIDDSDLAGRNVSIITLDRFPAFVRHGAGISGIRINGVTHPESWEIDGSNTSLYPGRALDEHGDATSASLSPSHPDLALKFTGDLSGHAKRLGAICGAFLEVRYYSPTPPRGNYHLELTLDRGEEHLAVSFPWPETSASLASVPEQSVSVASSGDSQPAPEYPFPVNAMNVCFDDVSGEEDVGGENILWKNSHRAKDGDFGLYAESFSGPGVTENRNSLEFTFSRKAMEDGAAEIAGVTFYMVMDSGGTPPKDVLAEARISDKYNGSILFNTDSVTRRYGIDIPGDNLVFSDLTDPLTSFRISAPDGSYIRIYEAWLEIRYRLNGPEQFFQNVAGQFDVLLSEMEIELPTPMISHRVDMSGLVLANGGWDFFDGVTPLELTLSLVGNGGEIHITDVALITEYRPRNGAELEEDLTASVQGLPLNGALAENPADAVTALLVHPAFGEFTDDDLDNVSFNAVKDELESEGIISSHRFASRIQFPNALKTILREAGIRLVHDSGQFRLLPPVYDFNAVGALQAFSYPVDKSLLLDIPELATDDLGNRRFQTTFPLTSIHLERGDRVKIDYDGLGLENALGEVASMEIVEPDVAELSIRLAQAGTSCSEFDSQNRILRLFEGEAILFVMGNRVCARLEPSGDLRIMGELIIDGFTPVLQEQPVCLEETEGQIRFGVPEGENFLALFAIDQDGNLLAAGHVYEGMNMDSVSLDACCGNFESGGDPCFGFSLDRSKPVLYVKSSDAAILLCGEIIEL